MLLSLLIELTFLNNNHIKIRYFFDILLYTGRKSVSLDSCVTSDSSDRENESCQQKLRLPQVKHTQEGYECDKSVEINGDGEEDEDEVFFGDVSSAEYMQRVKVFQKTLCNGAAEAPNNDPRAASQIDDCVVRIHDSPVNINEAQRRRDVRGNSIVENNHISMTTNDKSAVTSNQDCSTTSLKHLHSQQTAKHTSKLARFSGLPRTRKVVTTVC